MGFKSAAYHHQSQQQQQQKLQEEQCQIFKRSRHKMALMFQLYNLAETVIWGLTQSQQDELRPSIPSNMYTVGHSHSKSES